MLYKTFLFAGIFLSAWLSCSEMPAPLEKKNENKISTGSLKLIRDFTLPQGYAFVTGKDSLYAEWLLNLRLRSDKTVYIYTGREKQNQSAQLAVLDMDIGKKNLVQCADAVIKLRAEYFFSNKQYDKISFLSTSGKVLSFSKWQQGARWKESNGTLVETKSTAKFRGERESFNVFMELVYSYCGTYSLNKQLSEVNDPVSVQPGDVFIKGGFPGHAVLVTAVAADSIGNKIFLLAQGYMPAQDIHVLKNYISREMSPWYGVSELYPLRTPEWIFEKGSLKRW